MEQTSQNTGNSRRRFKKRWIALILLILIVAGAYYVTSPRRDLEVALGVKHLPGSIRHEEIIVDAWTDYSVRASFEIDPDDMRRLLEARSYQKSEAPPRSANGNTALNEMAAQVRFWGSFSPDANPALGEWEPAWKYEVVNDARIHLCQIFVNRDFSKACIIYSVD